MWIGIGIVAVLLLFGTGADIGEILTTIIFGSLLVAGILAAVVYFKKKELKI